MSKTKSFFSHLAFGLDRGWEEKPKTIKQIEVESVTQVRLDFLFVLELIIFKIV